jgi:hypothetical protein
MLSASFNASHSFSFPEEDATTIVDSLDGPPASVTSVLMAPPVVVPQQLPWSRVPCCTPQLPCAQFRILFSRPGQP